MIVVRRVWPPSMVGGILRKKKRHHMNNETKERVRSILEQLSYISMELLETIYAEDESTLDLGYLNGLNKLILALSELTLTNEGRKVNGVFVKK